MQTRSISVTEAARNFSDCVNRARYQNVTFILHRNGVPVARIIPEGEKLRPTACNGEIEAAVISPETESPASEPARSLW